MTQRNLGIVLLKVLGVVCVVKAIEYAATIGSFVVSVVVGRETFENPVSSMLPITIVLLSYLALAFLLLCRGEVLAAKLFPAEDAAFPEGADPTDEWYVLAFTLLGVYLLVWYVPFGIAQCVTSFLWSPSEAAFSTPPPGTVQTLIRLAMQLGLGLYLALGARGIVALVRKLRRAGIAGDETT